MKTLHIKHHQPDGWLLKDLYKNYLKNDPLWHFVYWKDGWTHKAFIEGQNLIIRLNETSLEDIKDYLDKIGGIQYEIYDFPHPRGKFQLGILKKSWEVKYPNVSLPMLHAISEAKMAMKRKEYFVFIEHYLHIVCNLGMLNHAEEAILLWEKLGSTLSIVTRWYANMEKSSTYFKMLLLERDRKRE